VGFAVNLINDSAGPYVMVLVAREGREDELLAHSTPIVDSILGTVPFEFRLDGRARRFDLAIDAE
jgi:hypothetical protein